MAERSAFDRGKLAVAGIALAIVAFVAINLWAAIDLRGARLDLTEGHQFTLSEGTESLLSEIEETITLRLYVSSSLREASPFYGSFADRVEDMLRAYADLAEGKLLVELIDPEPFSVEEDRAVGYGLQAIPLDTAGSVAYLGVAGTNSTDDVDVLPLVTPERETLLEYDLTRMVFNLAHPEKPVVAVISSLPINGDPAMQYQPWQVWAQLQQLFELRWLGGEVREIEDDVDIVMLVHPKDVDEATLYAVDQRVMAGARLLVFLDPHSEADIARSRQQPGVVGSASELATLLEPWGVRMVSGKIVGDPHAARQVGFPVQGRQQVVDYLAWLSLGRDALATDEAPVADLSRINLASAGYLEPVTEIDGSFVPLISSSADSMAIDVTEVQMAPDPLRLLSGFVPGNERLPMAARVSGVFTSAFGDAAPEGVEPGADHLASADGERTVIVVADTDILDDHAWISSQRLLGRQLAMPVADNADLVANLMDFLVGSEALMSLRGRDVALRPFTRLSEIRQEAERRYRAKEQALLEELSEVERKISLLQISEDGETVRLGPEQQEEIEGFRLQLLETRGELREVQRALREDIEALESKVRFAGIAAVPLLIMLVALVMAVIRRARFRRGFENAVAEGR